MKLAADYRALARDALRGRWKTAVLAGLLASALGANIVNATGNITSNANRANQNSNITPGGSLELFSQANGGRLLAVLVVCIVVWTLFTLWRTEKRPLFRTCFPRKAACGMASA